MAAMQDILSFMLQILLYKAIKPIELTCLIYLAINILEYLKKNLFSSFDPNQL